MLLADLDNLKELNDSLGHARGDQALAAVAQALTAQTVEDSDNLTVPADGADPHERRELRPGDRYGW